MNKLKQIYADLIKEKLGLRGEIADLTGKHETTIFRWADSNSPFLTMPDVLTVISKYTGDPVSDLTEITTKEIVK